MTSYTETGYWECEKCGKMMFGERIEPPVDHLHRCDKTASLTFHPDNE